MKIEIGKTYQIVPKYKKSYCEIEYFEHAENPNKVVSVETLWRSGTFNITPQNTDEVEMIEHAMKTEDVFDPYSFEDFEFCDSWDGISEDLEFLGADWTEEEIQLIEEKRESGEWFISELLEEQNYHSTDSEVFIYNGIEVEEVDPDTLGN